MTESQALAAFWGSAPNAAAERERLRLHIDECRRCAVLVTEAVRATGTPADRTLLQPGERIGNRYVTVRFLARGGMGEVWEAHDVELHQQVALKTLVAASAGDPHAVGRLKEELVLARRIAHPNVCRLLEFGVFDRPGAGPAGPIPFLTMELLSGETLGQRLRRKGPLAIDEARSLMQQLLAGLAAIHAAGVVHRDVKSENVFLVPQPQGMERAVVMDLGLARPLMPDSPRLVETGGFVVGTLDYMAPEQIEGAAPAPCFDVYGAGVVLYESLTGTLPFTGETLFGAALKKLSESPRPPSALRADVAPAWDAAILRCLERDPARRFPSIEALRAALFDDEEIAPRRQPTQVRRVMVRAALATAGIAAGLSLVALRYDDAAPRAPLATASAPSLTAAAALGIDGPFARAAPLPVEPGAAERRLGAHATTNAGSPESSTRRVGRRRVERAQGVSPAPTVPARTPAFAPAPTPTMDSPLAAPAPRSAAEAPSGQGGVAPKLRDPDDVVDPFRPRR